MNKYAVSGIVGNLNRVSSILVGCLAASLLAVSVAAQETPPAAEAAAPETSVAQPPPAGTLDRIRQAGKISLGYLADARPFSYRNEAGHAAGYTVALCEQVAETIKAELGQPALAVDWVPVTIENRFTDVQQGKIELMCGADTATLSRRKTVDFSIPVFLDGIGALLRADAPQKLKDVLRRGPPPTRPIWRASAPALEHRTFAVVAGSTSEVWLKGRLTKLGVTATVAPVAGFAAGLQSVQDGSADVLFGDRAVLLDAAHSGAATGEFEVLNRYFTREPLALALARGDDDFRLLVDATLSRLYPTPKFRELYTQWIGEPDKDAISFLSANGLPE